MTVHENGARPLRAAEPLKTMPRRAALQELYKADPECEQSVRRSTDFVVPQAMLAHDELSAAAMRLWSVMFNLADCKPGTIHASKELLAHAVGRSVRSLGPSRGSPGPLKQLEALGAIRIIDRRTIYVEDPSALPEHRVRRADPQREMFPDDDSGEFPETFPVNASGNSRQHSPSGVGIRIRDFSTDDEGRTTPELTTPDPCNTDAARRGVARGSLAPARSGGGGGSCSSENRQNENRQRQTSSTTPSGGLTTIVAADGSDSKRGWKASLQRLKDLGMAAAANAIRVAKDSGISQPSVVALTDFYERHQARFDCVGALHDRIVAAHPGQKIADGWPLPTKQFEQQQRRERRALIDKEKQAEREAEQRELAESKRREAAIELRFGGLLDALPVEHVEPHVPKILANFWRADGVKSPSVRLILLEKLRSGEIQSPATEPQRYPTTFSNN